MGVDMCKYVLCIGQYCYFTSLTVVYLANAIYSDMLLQGSHTSFNSTHNAFTYTMYSSVAWMQVIALDVMYSIEILLPTHHSNGCCSSGMNLFYYYSTSLFSSCSRNCITWWTVHVCFVIWWSYLLLLKKLQLFVKKIFSKITIMQSQARQSDWCVIRKHLHQLWLIEVVRCPPSSQDNYNRLPIEWCFQNAAYSSLFCLFFLFDLHLLWGSSHDSYKCLSPASIFHKKDQKQNLQNSRMIEGNFIQNTEYNTTLLPSVNTIAQGIFCLSHYRKLQSTRT